MAVVLAGIVSTLRRIACIPPDQTKNAQSRDSLAEIDKSTSSPSRSFTRIVRKKLAPGVEVVTDQLWIKI